MSVSQARHHHIMCYVLVSGTHEETFGNLEKSAETCRLDLQSDQDFSETLRVWWFRVPAARYTNPTLAPSVQCAVCASVQVCRAFLQGCLSQCPQCTATRSTPRPYPTLPYPTLDPTLDPRPSTLDPRPSNPLHSKYTSMPRCSSPGKATRYNYNAGSFPRTMRPSPF